MYIAMTYLYSARWSDDIHVEWMRNVLKDIPDILPSKIERVRELMNIHVPEGLIQGYEYLIPTLTLPDPKDRHVLALAIHAGADTILTFNLKDFPPKILKSFGISAAHPDEFLLRCLELDHEVICRAAKQHRQSLKKPAFSVEEYLGLLKRQGLPQTVELLRDHAEFI